MMSCWEEYPGCRPTFDELEDILSNMYLDALNGDRVNENESLNSVRLDVAEEFDTTMLNPEWHMNGFVLNLDECSVNKM